MLFASSPGIGPQSLIDQIRAETEDRNVLTALLADIEIEIETKLVISLETVAVVAAETEGHASLHNLHQRSSLKSSENLHRLPDPAVQSLSLWAVLTSTLMVTGTTQQSTLPCRTSLRIPQSKIDCKYSPCMTT